MKRLALALVLTVSTALPLANAHALSLDVLAAGGATLNSGSLTFFDFEVIVTGDIEPDLSSYDVSAIAGGIAITGPYAASDGETGDMFLAFSVSSSAPIIAVDLLFNGAASGPGSSASVTETFQGINDRELFVFATGGTGLKLFDSTGIPATETLRVFKDVLLDSAGLGDLAAISRIEQRFLTDVPEPAALVLAGLGLAALSLARRRTL